MFQLSVLDDRKDTWPVKITATIILRSLLFGTTLVCIKWTG